MINRLKTLHQLHALLLLATEHCRLRRIVDNDIINRRFDNYAKNFRNPSSKNETPFQQPLVLSIVPVITMKKIKKQGLIKYCQSSQNMNAKFFRIAHIKYIVI
ncbi:hypothetical protein LHK94_18710 [Dickeya zeae]|uniref:hypothetical protein n=1 Tax=Dickeya zeae TaxID=204042 RepID=UPI001CF98294|nr:hypothetical protein [Dickeya zeae]UCZ75004.1 hypothetical protein LHK94_18710 [Dickeya zeae]